MIMKFKLQINTLKYYRARVSLFLTASSNACSAASFDPYFLCLAPGIHEVCIAEKFLQKESNCQATTERRPRNSIATYQVG